MPKSLLKRYIPSPEQIHAMKGLGFLRKYLSHPSLWHLNRRSASLAALVGLFCACLPIPFQMVPATLLAVWLRVNLPLVIALVWITNPLTILPFMYAGYGLGSLALNVPMLSWSEIEELALAALQTSSSVSAPDIDLLTQLKPFFLGSVLLGLVTGCVGYVGMRLFWRWHVLRAWRRRAQRRASTEQ